MEDECQETKNCAEEKKGKIQGLNAKLPFARF